MPASERESEQRRQPWRQPWRSPAGTAGAKTPPPSPSMGELLASCAAASAVSTPPPDPREDTLPALPEDDTRDAA
ncbi:hypothetical protein ACIBCM_19720 [Streptomyces sp. NPDC051018]|uniref:hypothetical protein n=1 Tax=Streptomyces sp. NPDC051018 TaxID=3365639 RepID=UPI0037B934A7